MFSLPLTERLATAGMVAVVTVENPEDGVQVTCALLAGGMSAIALTLLTPVAAETIRWIRGEVSEIPIGGGAVANAGDVEPALGADAAFGVSPGCNPRAIRAAADKGPPIASGVMTPTDIEIAVECNCNVLKFFPAQSAGWVKHLQAMSAPFRRFGRRFIPLGEIGSETLADYLWCPQVVRVGGCWFGSAELIQRKDGGGIPTRAAEASARLSACRSASPPRLSRGHGEGRRETGRTQCGPGAPAAGRSDWGGECQAVQHD